MKYNFHFHTYSRIIAFFIFIVSFFLIYQAVQTRADVNEYSNIEIGGWGWSNITGWVSLNCLNDYDGDGELDNSCSGGAGAWGLEVNSSEAGSPSIKGCGWGGNDLGVFQTLNWVCFSDYDGYIVAPENGVGINSGGGSGGDAELTNSLCYNTNSFCSSSNDYADIVALNGYQDSNMKFPISNPEPEAGISGCFNCWEYKECHNGTDFIGTDCTGNESACDVDNGEYCLVKENNCDNCLEYSYFVADGYYCSSNHSKPCPNGNECTDLGDGNCISYEEGDLDWVKGGYDCDSCTFEDINNTCDLNAYGTNNNTCYCAEAYSIPGLMIDNRHNASLDTSACTNGGNETNCERGVLCGWGWNSWEQGDLLYGLGWFQFSPRITADFNPYFSVEEGSIYALSDIFSSYAPPYNRYNASYLIEAGGSITNLVSSSTPGFLQSNRPKIEFLTENLDVDKFENVLGKLDISGLSIPAVDSYNKYGSEVITYSDSTALENILNHNSGLGQKVIGPNAAGDVDISTLIEIKSNNLASGIVFVSGDLNINENITYQPDVINTLQSIPSIVWIVEGDVNIADNVTSIVGTYIVLGDGSTGSGQFNTGLSSTNSLIVYGSVLAKKFNLQRAYYDPNNPDIPAEQFVNDGRLQANPPPGLLDFSKAMPRFNMNP